MMLSISTHRLLASKARTFRLPVGQRQWFQSLAEYDQWRSDIKASTLQAPNLQPLVLEESAPFLHSVSPMADHLKLTGPPPINTTNSASTDQPKSPRHCLLQCTYPLKTDALLRNSVSDFSNWSSFRLGKFYETVDALTADVAYRHVADDAHTVALVTAGHYFSRKFQRTRIQQDLLLRSYVTSVGTSSMEVRTDALQIHDEKEVLVNVCHTVMVAIDNETGKSLGKVGRSIPELVLETTDDHQREALAKQHASIRRERAAHAMLLRSPVSMPPTQEEFQHLHQLHQARALNQLDQYYPRVADYTFRSSTVIFPENRNVHGKLFGGFVMEEADKLAQYTASFFSKGERIIPLGIDEAIFLQPISIGDLVTFTARLVQSTATTCRVLVIVEVRDPAHRDRVPSRSNRLLYVFGGSSFPKEVVPETYSEILMHMDAQRRHRVEGPTEKEVQGILQESRNLEGA